MNYGLLLTFPLAFTSKEAEAIISDEASIRVNELEGPYGPNYDSLCEMVEEKLWTAYSSRCDIETAVTRQRLAKV